MSVNLVPPSGASHQITFHLDPPNGENKFSVTELNYHKDLNGHAGGGQLKLPLDHEVYQKFKINKIFELTWTWGGVEPVKVMSGYITHVKRKGNYIEISFMDKGALLEKKNYLKYRNMRRSAIISDIIRKAGLNPVLNWAGTVGDDLTSYTDDPGEKEKEPKPKKKKKKKVKAKKPKITHTNIQIEQTSDHIDGKTYSSMLQEVMDTSNMNLSFRINLNDCYVSKIDGPPSDVPLFLDDTLNVLKNSVSIHDQSAEMINTVTVYYKNQSGVKHVTHKYEAAIGNYGEKTATVDKFDIWRKSDAEAQARKIIHKNIREHGLQIEVSAIAHPYFNIMEWCKLNLSKYQIQGLALMITRVNFKFSSGKAQVMDICLNEYTPVAITGSQEYSDAVSFDGSLGDLASSLGSPAAIRQWIDNNIIYQFYYGKIRTAERVLKDKRGNCFDQTDLGVAMMKHIGYNAWRVCGQICKGYRHCNGRVVIDGRTVTFDTACSKLNHL